MSGAYYNEIDPYAAQWLRNLIAADLIAPGEVDERSIVDVRPADLAGFTQCHFFAGIGGWSYALRLAGWPDDRPVWTGSCPCQPFSSAGKQRGEDDERHLWPVFAALIRERKPAVVFGEQVASKLGREWLAGVRADLEDMAYAVGAADLCAAGKGAPHIRQRLFWLADAGSQRRDGEHALLREEAGGRDEPDLPEAAGHGGASRMADADLEQQHGGWLAGPGRRLEPAIGSGSGGLADAHGWQRGRLPDGEGRQPHGEAAGRQQGDRLTEPDRLPRGLADADGGLSRNGELQSGGQHGQQPEDGRSGGVEHAPSDGRIEWRPEPSGRRLVGGRRDHWADYDIVHCTDGKARRFEPGSFPLAHGVPARVGRLRGYGNAISPPPAAEFISAYLDVREAA